MIKPIYKLCLEKGNVRNIATKGANTSNLLFHLRTNHPSFYVKVKPFVSNGTAGTSRAKQTGEQQSLAASFARGTQYAWGGKKWQTLTIAVICFIDKEMMPLSVIDKPTFQQLLKEFDPQCDPLSRKYLSDTAIPAMYKQASKVNCS